MHTRLANISQLSKAPNKALPTPELALPHCRTKQEAGWGGQQVLFLKHIWENSIKRGERVQENMKKRRSFFKWGSLSSSPCGRNAFPQSPPAPWHFIADSFRICNCPNSNMYIQPRLLPFLATCADITSSL